MNPKEPILKNAASMAIANPQSFKRPTPEELNRLRPRDLVKVCAESERFWVQLEECDLASGILVGRIDNDLVDFDGHGLRLGDRIRFAVDNIYDVDGPE